MLISDTPAWKALSEHAKTIAGTHLRELLQDEARCTAMRWEVDGVLLDASRQNATRQTIDLLVDLARDAGLTRKIKAMANGEKINGTENRAVLHMALRAPKRKSIEVDGHDVVPDVHAVLDRIKAFSKEVRTGKWKGATGKKLTSVVSIGIGGSYLGPEFVYEAMRTDPDCTKAAKRRTLRFLANVDPIDITRALADLDPERTLVIVVSKTFTTAETMLNARTVRKWIVDALGAEAVAKHMIAVSTNLDAVKEFGIDPANAFGFWDWVGGRYSVCSAVGVLPLALHFGYKPVQEFLNGAHAMDRHFLAAPAERNLPALMGLFGIWQSSFLGRPSRALLPYCQSLLKLAPHIQQVDMESNGKRVTVDGQLLPFEAGEVDFGEPGTNGQHSFYQLIHQGRVIPCDFIGFRRSQTPVALPGEPVDNHDELMCNFFAQPDALAYGKTEAELVKENVPAALVPHKVFPGNRPSNVLLLDQLTPYATGQLLALYEHRTAVQGFIWGVNSFDQWGVELGKVLAKTVRGQLQKSRTANAPVAGFNPSTGFLLKSYLGQA